MLSTQYTIQIENADTNSSIRVLYANIPKSQWTTIDTTSYSFNITTDFEKVSSITYTDLKIIMEDISDTNIPFIEIYENDVAISTINQVISNKATIIAYKVDISAYMTIKVYTSCKLRIDADASPFIDWIHFDSEPKILIKSSYKLT